MIIFLDIGSRGNQNVQDKMLQIHILNKAPWHEFSPSLVWSLRISEPYNWKSTGYDRYRLLTAFEPGHF